MCIHDARHRTRSRAMFRLPSEALALKPETVFPIVALIAIRVGLPFSSPTALYTNRKTAAKPTSAKVKIQL